MTSGEKRAGAKRDASLAAGSGRAERAKTRLLLVEDDADLARGLVFNLEHEGYRVLVARDGAEAQRAMKGGGDPVALVVLDLQLPDGDGLALLHRWRVDGSRVPVICLTARSQETDVVSGLKLGADDYMTKPFGLAQLLARIEAVLRRTRSTDEATSTMSARSDRSGPGTGAVAEVAANSIVLLGEVRVDLASHRVHRPDGEQELTPIEADLLRYLLARRGRVLDRSELLKSMWGVERRHETRTLDNHVARLRKKIEVDPARPRFLVTVHGVGYRFETG